MVSPTNCSACPVRIIRRLLWCPSDAGDRLFSHGTGEATSDWFLKSLRWWLYDNVEKRWIWSGLRSCRKGACTTASLAKMPEYFTDTLGDWKSRAKELYRTTARQAAHVEFCRLLGNGKQKERPSKGSTSTMNS